MATSLRMGISTAQSRPSRRATSGRACIPGPLGMGGRMLSNRGRLLLASMAAGPVWGTGKLRSVPTSPGGLSMHSRGWKRLTGREEDTLKHAGSPIYFLLRKVYANIHLTLGRVSICGSVREYTHARHRNEPTPTARSGTTTIKPLWRKLLKLPPLHLERIKKKK